MTRQSILIWVLVVVAMFGLPMHYMDAAIEESRTQLDAGQSQLTPLRREASEVRERDEKLTARIQAVQAVKGRLIASQPFATIQAELTAAAARSGVTLGGMTLEGPSAVTDLPMMVRYQATVLVTGNRSQYLEFLRLLENHRLLIELPEATLRLQAAPAKGVLPQVQQTLMLGFFTASGKQ